MFWEILPFIAFYSCEMLRDALEREFDPTIYLNSVSIFPHHVRLPDRHQTLNSKLFELPFADDGSRVKDSSLTLRWHSFRPLKFVWLSPWTVHPERSILPLHHSKKASDPRIESQAPDRSVIFQPCALADSGIWSWAYVFSEGDFNISSTDPIFRSWAREQGEVKPHERFSQGQSKIPGKVTHLRLSTSISVPCYGLNLSSESVQPDSKFTSIKYQSSTWNTVSLFREFWGSWAAPIVACSVV